ncbi:MAG: L-seryl-tRNA(Sec) selenium transferase [Candidatus Krumholzibacteriota bacterium]|nr:L-seryl-tRNA(Sec) selenium transferase [Candidatus Krumholzibacteriota bacterium]
MNLQVLLKSLPSVEKVLKDDRINILITPFSRKGVVQLVRRAISGYRRAIIEGEGTVSGREEDLTGAIVTEVVEKVKKLTGSVSNRVINASGVVLYTNLGRAVLGEQVKAEIKKAASGYIDLEIDLETGQRVKRERRAAKLLSLITGASDAHIVNNNAAAVFLAVNTLAENGAIAVSRGELVEIGGSFRLPDILSKSARRVIEVGTTNRTHIKDYKKAILNGADLLLKVHKSNYSITGYTNEVSLKELVELGRENNIPVMYDQGSGLLYPIEAGEIEGEESISEIIGSGVDLICFSADKMFGGPQGGILLGSSDLIESMRKNHLSRALRIDKLTLAGLEKVLIHYWNGELESIPVLESVNMSAEEIKKRAVNFSESIEEELSGKISISTVEGLSSVGGGSFPNYSLRSELVKITLAEGNPDRFSVLLRKQDPAVIVRVKGDSIFIDLRTVSHDEEILLKKAIVKGLRDIASRE